MHWKVSVPGSATPEPPTQLIKKKKKPGHQSVKLRRGLPSESCVLFIKRRQQETKQQILASFCSTDFGLKVDQMETYFLSSFVTRFNDIFILLFVAERVWTSKIHNKLGMACKFVKKFIGAAHYPLYKSVKKINFVTRILIAKNKDGARQLDNRL